MDFKEKLYDISSIDDNFLFSFYEEIKKQWVVRVPVRPEFLIEENDKKMILETIQRPIFGWKQRNDLTTKTEWCIEYENETIIISKDPGIFLNPGEIIYTSKNLFAIKIGKTRKLSILEQMNELILNDLFFTVDDDDVKILAVEGSSTTLNRSSILIKGRKKLIGSFKSANHKWSHPLKSLCSIEDTLFQLFIKKLYHEKILTKENNQIIFKMDKKVFLTKWVEILNNKVNKIKLSERFFTNLMSDKESFKIIPWHLISWSDDGDKISPELLFKLIKNTPNTYMIDDSIKNKNLIKILKGVSFGGKFILISTKQTGEYCLDENLDDLTA